MADLQTLQSEIATTFTVRDEKAWEEAIRGFTIDAKFDSVLDDLADQYVEKITGIREQLEGDWTVTLTPRQPGGKIKTVEELGNELVQRLGFLTDKEARLLDKLACVLKERELRKAGLVERTPHHTAYYCDYTNGTDGTSGTVHDGLKEANHTAETGTDATHVYVTATTVLDNDTDDNYNGDYLYNVTRAAGATISDYDADDGAGYSVLTTGSIANQASGDTFYIIRAWKTIAKYTTTTVRTTDDILYVRANQTHNYGSAGGIAFDESGDGDTWIKIIGCDTVTNNPWGDASNTKPILDFQDGNNYLSFSADRFWWLERLHITQSAYSSGAVILSGVTAGTSAKFVNCDFSDSGASNAELITIAQQSWCILEGCTFVDGWSSTIANSGSLQAYNCQFNGGTTHQSSYAIYNSGYAYFQDCSFGDSSTFGTAVTYRGSGCIYMRNCTYTGTLSGYTAGQVGELYMEDADGTFEAQLAGLLTGEITRGTAEARSGGADSYARMGPKSNCTLLNPLVLGRTECGFSGLWLTGDEEHTVTVYARVQSAWGIALLASEAYLKASYLDSDSDCGRTFIQSTQQISNDLDGDYGTWTAFSVTFTPQRTGWVYLWFCLAEYEAGKGIDVDIKPV